MNFYLFFDFDLQFLYLNLILLYFSFQLLPLFSMAYLLSKHLFLHLHHLLYLVLPQNILTLLRRLLNDYQRSLTIFFYFHCSSWSLNLFLHLKSNLELLLSYSMKISSQKQCYFVYRTSELKLSSKDIEPWQTLDPNTCFFPYHKFL